MCLPRGCGRVLCDTCCSHRAWKLEHAAFMDPVPVCGECVWNIRHAQNTRMLVRRWCHDRSLHYRHVVLDGDFASREWVRHTCTPPPSASPPTVVHKEGSAGTDADLPFSLSNAKGRGSKIFDGMIDPTDRSSVLGNLKHTASVGELYWFLPELITWPWFECSTDQHPDIVGRLIISPNSVC